MTSGTRPVRMQLFQTSVTHGGQYVMMMMRPNGILFLLLARALAPALLLISIKSDTLPRERDRKRVFHSFLAPSMLDAADSKHLLIGRACRFRSFCPQVIDRVTIFDATF